MDPQVLTVAVTGSTGLIGSALVSSLRDKGHRVIRMTRPDTALSADDDRLPWDVAEGTIDTAGLEGVDAVVHLAGAGIGEGRWSPKRKSRLLRSRTESTRLLSSALASLDRPPSVLISGSAIGVYGAHRGDEELTETSVTRSDDFLAALCERWEESTQEAEESGIRVVHLRTGLVMDGDGGVLARQLLPFKLGLGGRVGPGDQWLSWISLHDEVAAIEHLLTASEVSGPVNATSPAPVRQRDFATTLGDVLHRPTFLPTPLWPLRIVLTSEMVDATLLASQRVLPKRLAADGFTFEHTELEPALRAVLNRPA
ncbi:MAG: TIGR01777 family oxidoreductase [Acidimicrobiia bacterium]|nr:TIGR01777 family oxidoreductase [Acidimicrobiia bacterium]